MITTHKLEAARTFLRVAHGAIVCFAVAAHAAWAAEAEDKKPEPSPSFSPAPLPSSAPEGGPNPPTAVGGYRPMDGGEAAPVSLGRFVVTPTLSAAVGHDSNVNLRTTNKVSSMLYTLSPGVSATTRSGAHSYYARYFGNYGHYATSSVDDYEDHSLGVGASSDWTSRLRSQLRYELFRGHDPRGATATAVAAPERWHTSFLRGGVAYGARGAQGNIETEFGVGERRYDTNRVVTAQRDYTTTEAAGAFFLRMRPAVYSFVQVKASRFEYDSNSSLDSTEMRYYGGMRWEATAKTQGAVKAGYMTKTFSEASRADASALSYEASVTWSPLTYSVFVLNGVRTFAEQTSGGSYILTDNATLLWNHAWSSRVRTSALLAYGRDEHQGIARTDTRTNLGMKATYGFRRNFRVGGEVRQEERSSNISNVEYKRSLVLITLDASL